MKKKLITTSNSLYDIIGWLKEGYIISLYSSNCKYKFYFSKASLDVIEDEEIIYINLDKDSSLIDENEWPWYIKNEGFVDYKSINIVPTNKEKIYSLKL